MKIFISHSSYDKWVARTISGNLNERGITTFLDEKDIQTGESIDSAISKHLAESDELLLLLSPSSLKSTWVFIEIGGAKALGKRVAPILLHVGANEIPHPISQYLCRDINDIERYFAELEQRKRGHQQPPTPEPKTRRSQVLSPTITKGMTVRVKDSATISDESKRKNPIWVDTMDALSGRTFRVVDIDSDDWVQLEGEEWAFIPEWLEIVP